MGKNVRKRTGVQGDTGERRVSLQLSLPMIDALVGVEQDYLGLCIRSGDIVLRAMLEADRTELCGPKWGRGPDREVVRAGTTRSPNLPAKRGFRDDHGHYGHRSHLFPRPRALR